MSSSTLICALLLILAPFSLSSSLPPRSRYTRPHSLGRSYKFNPAEWSSINVTDMQYKYRRNTADLPSVMPSNTNMNNSSLDIRSAKKKAIPKNKNSKNSSDKKNAFLHASTVVQTIHGALNNVWEGLRGIGQPKPVIITWYTGNDLKNPSCWAQNVWTPTDASFACALTLQGWKSKPQCFKFLELCASAQKCVFVRVVDTCAGCAAGSQHVDLTRAAFAALADFDTGVLTVNLRPATEPSGWYQDLWGPKV